MIYWSDKNPATSDKKICNFVVCYAMLDSLPIFRNHSFFWLWPFRNFFLHKQLLCFPQGIRKKNNHKLYGSPDQFKQTNVYCDLRVKICLFLHMFKRHWTESRHFEAKDSIQYSKKPNKHSFCTEFVNLVTLNLS